MSKIVYVATRTSAVPREDAIDGARQAVVIGPGETPTSTSQRLVVANVAELRPGLQRLVDILWRSAPGRTLVRISPFDRSRRFWRAVREQRPVVADALKGADVIVAADRDALWATWHLARKTRGPAVVYGVSAAKFALNIQ
ncbi:hypothetical protein ACSAGD_03915 [Paramicrobacterium sp. CJ85]|uniref:hypothetical protein n=1 Tax=Paramicrobacterium sp. CJ85 TaxID=3445355 RepID=UPI003F62AC53